MTRQKFIGLLDQIRTAGGKPVALTLPPITAHSTEPEQPQLATELQPDTRVEGGGGRSLGAPAGNADFTVHT